MATTDERPHVLAIPYPSQGDMMPLMKFSYKLVDRGCKVTFINTESIHVRLVGQLQRKELDHFNLVSIPEGSTPEQQKNPDIWQHANFISLASELEKLIQNVKESSNNGKIACAIVDFTQAWAFDVVRRMGIRYATYTASSAATKALVLNIPKLIEMAAINENGTPVKNDTIIWSETMPGIKPIHLPWYSDPTELFQAIAQCSRNVMSAEWIFCNTCYELEPEAIALVPKLRPIGLLQADNQLGSLWSEDLTCLSWLDRQAANTVIYIAFGSIAVHTQVQIEELAFGLELLGRPFLWVVRSESDLYSRATPTCPDGFEERFAHLGKIVSWAPQQKVLSHPSIACFISHCGWNSILEGVSSGLPFICCPYFSDQFYNATYVTDVWKVGLGLNPDDNGIISRCEIERKLNQLLGDHEIKENSLRLKEIAIKCVRVGGSSVRNLELFVEELKQ